MERETTAPEVTPFSWQADNGHKWRGELRWEWHGTRFECTGLTLEAPKGFAVTSSALRRLPIGKLMSDERRRRSKALRYAATIPYGIGLDLGSRTLTAAVRGKGRRDAALRLAQQWEETHAGRRGPKGYGPEHFADVARTYLAALNTTRKPTQAVADKFVVSKSAAAKWVARCRVMGLLPPAQKGKAG